MKNLKFHFSLNEKVSIADFLKSDIYNMMAYWDTYDHSSLCYLTFFLPIVREPFPGSSSWLLVANLSLYKKRVASS